MNPIEPIRHVACGSALIWKQVRLDRIVTDKRGQPQHDTALFPWCEVCRTVISREQFNKPEATVCAL